MVTQTDRPTFGGDFAKYRNAHGHEPSDTTCFLLFLLSLVNLNRFFNSNEMFKSIEKSSKARHLDSVR